MPPHHFIRHSTLAVVITCVSHSPQFEVFQAEAQHTLNKFKTDFDQAAQNYIKFSNTQAQSLQDLEKKTRDGVRKGVKRHDDIMSKLKTQVQGAQEKTRQKSEQIKNAMVALMD